MQVRQGDVRDWPFIYALSKEVARDSISPWRRQPMEKSLKYRENMLKGFWTWIQQTDSVVFIAEIEDGKAGKAEKTEKTGEDEKDNKVPIGYLILYPDAKEELTGLKQGWIMDFAVLAAYRGQGAGKAMLKFAEDYCREKGLEYLGLAVSSHNIRALTMYEKFGFIEERKIMVKIL